MYALSNLKLNTACIIHLMYISDYQFNEETRQDGGSDQFYPLWSNKFIALQRAVWGHLWVSSLWYKCLSLRPLTNPLLLVSVRMWTRATFVSLAIGLGNIQPSEVETFKIYFIFHLTQ